jgi:hypothetical protein
VTLDAGLAASYAYDEIEIEEFANRISETRKLHNRGIDFGNESTHYYLKKSEYRLVKDEQTDIINQDNIPGTDGEVVNIEVVEVQPNENEIYYKYTAPSDGQSLIREGIFMKSYWEAIRNVSRQGLVHHYPDGIRVYANVPGDRDMESSVRTKYAFDFIRATGGNISDENILVNGAWNLYYGKINRKRYSNK